jgi:hypothetical protein
MPRMKANRKRLEKGMVRYFESLFPGEIPSLDRYARSVGYNGRSALYALRDRQDFRGGRYDEFMQRWEDCWNEWFEKTLIDMENHLAGPGVLRGMERISHHHFGLIGERLGLERKWYLFDC